MAKLDKNKTGLAFGLFLAVVHAIWAIIILVIPNLFQSFLNWIFAVHFLQPLYVLTTFNLLNAVFLVVITFICGYICGYIFAVVWNKIVKK